MQSSRAITVSLLLSACTPSDPAAVAYGEVLRPLLRANSRLATEVIKLAADAHDEHADSDAIRARWRDSVIPSSEHIAWQAATTESPQSWAAMHEELVEIWKQRASAYRELDFAITDASREAWTRAGESVNECQVAEEAWVAEASKALGAKGVRLDPYPTTDCCLTP